jgi:ion channel-forming bestrophin family protein
MLLRKRIPWHYVLGKIKYEVIAVGIYAAMIGVWHEELNLNNISIPLAVPTILGTIISLLLAFRSNQAYDRWWEARIVWGAIVNDSRTLLRQLQTFVNDPNFSVEIGKFLEVFGKRQMAWCYSLAESLRGHNPVAGKVEQLLTGKDLQYASKHTHVPNALLALHGMDIKRALEEGWINAYQQVQVDETLTRLCDNMGKCERIKNTIFPTTYSLYIHFTLYFFIIVLPFGLTEYFGFIQVPLVVAIASAFLLIEKMAIHLQDPFENKPTDTPMTSISQTIERDLRQMLRDYHMAEKQKNEKQQSSVYYIL